MDSDNEDTKVTRVADAALDQDDTACDTFLRAILEHEKATDSLGAAIRDRDANHAAMAAEAAFTFFLNALAQLHRLENTDGSRHDLSPVRLASFVVRTHHHAFADLLFRAQRELASPELHQLLEQHRISLDLAVGGHSPTPAAATSERENRGRRGRAASSSGG